MRKYSQIEVLEKIQYKRHTWNKLLKIGNWQNMPVLVRHVSSNFALVEPCLQLANYIAVKFEYFSIKSQSHDKGMVLSLNILNAFLFTHFTIYIFIFYWLNLFFFFFWFMKKWAIIILVISSNFLCECTVYIYKIFYSYLNRMPLNK